MCKNEKNRKRKTKRNQLIYDAKKSLGYTFTDIADAFEMSHERVRYIYQRIKRFEESADSWKNKLSQRALSAMHKAEIYNYYCESEAKELIKKWLKKNKTFEALKDIGKITDKELRNFSELD